MCQFLNFLISIFRYLWRCILRCLRSSCFRCRRSVSIRENLAKVGYCQADVVVALDFGNDKMGYAISFCRCKNRIYTGINGHKLREERIPTAVLLNPDDSPNSFGSDALEKYQNLALLGSHRSYHLFERFKVKLGQDESFMSDPTILDSEGRPFAAIEIVVHILRYLKDRAMETIESIQSFDMKMPEDNIIWIIPTLSTHAKYARDFIRKAAHTAGMTTNIRFVPELDAVSCLCKDVQLKVTYKNGIVCMPVGNKFVVADLGVGKVDVSSYEILENGELKKLTPTPNFYCMDGLNFEDKFCKLMEDIFGESILKSFKDKELYEYREMLKSFKKETISYDNKSDCVILHLPQSFVELVKQEKDLTVTQHVDKYTWKKGSNELSVYGERKLKLSKPVVEDLFWHYIMVVLDLLKKENQPSQVDSFLFAGGLAESAYIRKKIEEELSIKITLLQEPQMAVLKGAILYYYEH